MSKPKITATERFWSKVDKSGKCWIWLAGKDRKGYGKFSIGGKYRPDGSRNSMKSAHRHSFELANGPIPQHESFHGMCVLHSCDNPSCVNPEHLFLGTNEDNVRDMDRKGRRVVVSHRGEQHGMAVLTEAKAREVYIRAWLGELQSSIAMDFGISIPLVSAIKTGRLWAHLTPEVCL
jgi:hypothetical protein